MNKKGPQPIFFQSHLNDEVCQKKIFVGDGVRAQARGDGMYDIWINDEKVSCCVDAYTINRLAGQDLATR